MTADSWFRVGLLFAHLLLCAGALALVIKTDLRVLRRRVSASTMGRVHRQLVWLLAGLWVSGLAVVLLDFGTDLARVLEQPKLLAKLACVLVLTANAWVLRYHAMPRIVARRLLTPAEARGLAVVGAVSTASWLMAAFIGLARPMAGWSTADAVGFYGLELRGAVAVALVVCPGRLQRRHLGAGQTAVEQAAETLDIGKRLAR